MFRGSYVALITPFLEGGAIDWPSMGRLIERQVEAGTEGLVLCGSTGEGSSLSIEERIEVFRFAKRVAGGRIQLIGSTGTNRTGESVELTRRAKELGLDGVLVIVPYYNKPSEAGCIEHFRRVAEVGLPAVAYHHPGRTGLMLSVEAMCRLAALEGVVAIKEGSGDVAYATELVRKVEVPLLSSDDALLLAQLAIGFGGAISIVGNVLPREWKAFIELGLSGDLFEARRLFDSMYQKVESMTLETNPQCVKYALSVMGLCRSEMRLPLMEPSTEVRARLLDEFGNERCPAGLMGRA